MASDPGRRETLIALAAYASLVALAAALGLRMTVPWAYYQILSPGPLANDLSASILHLHAQPPLLNTGLGLALKLAALTGLRVETLILIVHVLLGAVAVWGFVTVAQHLLRSTALRWLCIALFVLHPVLYVSLFHYFYSFHELALLCLLPVAIARYLETRDSHYYALCCLGILLLVYTHSLFHLVWALIALLMVPWLANASAGSKTARQAPRLGTSHRIWLIGSILVLLAWPLKNLFLFDSFGYSSWTGYNMALELPIAAEDIPERDWSVPERFADIPVLSQKNKPDGSRNWNHHSIIRHSRLQGDLARAAIRDDPAALLRKAQLNYWNYTRFSGRNPYTGNFGTGGTRFPSAMEPWMAGYETLTLLDPRSRNDVAHRAYRKPRGQSWSLSGFTVLLPFILVGIAWVGVREFPGRQPRTGVAIFMLFTVLWVLAATLFVDGSEANRLRFSTEPYLLLLVFWAIERAWRAQQEPRES